MLEARSWRSQNLIDGIVRVGDLVVHPDVIVQAQDVA